MQESELLPLLSLWMSSWVFLFWVNQVPHVPSGERKRLLGQSKREFWAYLWKMVGFIETRRMKGWWVLW